MKRTISFIAIILILVVSIIFVSKEKNENVDNLNDIGSNIYFEDFYTNEILMNFKDITSLSKDYNVDTAIKDGCYVVGLQKTYNYDALDDFIKKYSNKEKAFIRIVTTTDEGDIVIYDIKYDEELSVIIDRSRDKFSNNEDRKIINNKYDSLEIKNNNMYFLSKDRDNQLTISIKEK